MIGLATIGNATIIAYDNKPVLSTDPWIGDEDSAYFGSWVLSHEIPKDYKNDINACEFIWLSHGHPDHVNPESLRRFKNKKILLPDHYGSRIYKDLLNEEFKVEILKDKKWYQISKNIRIKCVTNWIQDAILILEINNRIFINLNDAGIKFYSGYLKKTIKDYEHSYLLSLSGGGDADMINFYNEDGKFIRKKNDGNTAGSQLSAISNIIGTKNIIPFSSFHQYQREDSIWAQEYTTEFENYSKDIDINHNYIDPFTLLDCSNGSFSAINPKKLIVSPKKPELFGDVWSDELTKSEYNEVENYFLTKERLNKIIGFINIRVGGKENTVYLNKEIRNGVSFELPRNSLLKAIRLKIFDDLLIGNFMKTTLHNLPNLYYKNLKYVIANWSDNGGVDTEEELHKYITSYKEKAGREFLYDIFLDNSKNIFFRFISKNNKSILYRFAKKIYQNLK